jgi:ribosomal protein S18 acetylase RimI-like enzyme
MSSRNAALVASAEKVLNYECLNQSFIFVPKLSTEKAEELLLLTKTNMKGMYNACPEPEWKWNDMEKRKMFLHAKSRIILADNGFVCFRFVVEDKQPVVYVYELQIKPESTGKGLGRQLMEEVETFCAKSAPGIRKCMLTVFRHNSGALGFYKKLGYLVDSGSPKAGSYVILSKRLGV